MTDAITWNWPIIIQSFTGFATVWIAYLALTSWRNQHKAEKVTFFLDELTDVIHEYIQLMNLPIQRLQFIKIHIDSHKFDIDLKKDLDFPEAIAFIEKDGKEESKSLLEALTPCHKPLSKIRSLVVKGQVLSIKNYKECQDACNMLSWQYDRLQAFYSIISSTNINWEHEKVKENLKNILKITSEDIQQYLSNNQVAYLTFVKNTYDKVYKNS